MDMINYDFRKEYSLPVDESLKQLRISLHPMRIEENQVVEDHLESRGIIRLYECIGGIYLPMESVYCSNVAMLAEIRISMDMDNRKVCVDRIFCEYGHDEIIQNQLLPQVIYFADFYNCTLVMKKKKSKSNTVTCGYRYSLGC